VLKVRCFRPFPKKEIVAALRNAKRVRSSKRTSHSAPVGLWQLS